MSDSHNSDPRLDRGRIPIPDWIGDEIFYEDLLGKEYLHNGRGPDHYDCWGLCMEVYRRLGKSLPEFLPAIAEPACIHGVVNSAKNLFIEIQKPMPYCLVAFMVRPPFVTHIGVVLDTNKFIHLLRKSRVTIERLDSIAWSKRIKGFYSYAPPVGTRSAVSLHDTGELNAKG